MKAKYDDTAINFKRMHEGVYEFAACKLREYEPEWYAFLFDDCAKTEA